MSLDHTTPDKGFAHSSPYLPELLSLGVYLFDIKL